MRFKHAPNGVRKYNNLALSCDTFVAVPLMRRALIRPLILLWYVEVTLSANYIIMQ